VNFTNRNYTPRVQPPFRREAVPPGWPAAACVQAAARRILRAPGEHNSCQSRRRAACWHWNEANPMASEYLLKTEPSEYSFEDLKSDGVTQWDGVHNPVAIRNLSQMEAGTRLIIYETGDRKSAVGTATVVSVD